MARQLRRAAPDGTRVTRALRALALCGGLLISGAADVHAQSAVPLSGRVVRQDGSPLAGVMVLLQETGALEWTTVEGRYRFSRVRPGAYTLLLSLAGYSVSRAVSISAETPSLEVETVVDWPLSFV